MKVGIPSYVLRGTEKWEIRSNVTPERVHNFKKNKQIFNNRGASQDFYKKMPKNTDISPILGIKCSNKIVQKGYDFIFFSLKESFSLVL